MIRFTKEVNLELSAGEKALNRNGKLTPEQVVTVRNVGKAKVRSILIYWPIASIAAVAAVSVFALATGGSLDITVLYAVGAVFVALGFTFLLFLAPQFWLLYFRAAKREIVAPWTCRARKGSSTDKGTRVNFGSGSRGVAWRVPAEVGDTIVDGADYVVYRNGEVLHWFEPADAKPTDGSPVSGDPIEVTRDDRIVDVTDFAAGAPPTLDDGITND